MAEYKDFLQQKTLDNLSSKSASSLKQMLGDKNLMQIMAESSEVFMYIQAIERNYIPELETLAVDIVKKLFPIIERENITINAKIGERSGVFDKEEVPPPEDTEDNIDNNVKRRLINAISQGASIRGAFGFHLFNDNIDKIDDTLVSKYGKLLKQVFGVYDSDEAIAMFLNMVANNPRAVQASKGGESMVLIPDEEDPEITIYAYGANFPILLHEIVKGLYELVSLQGFRDLGPDQAKKAAQSVDKLSNEPEDLRYGKFIYDAFNEILANSNYNDPSIREFFFAEIYQLENTEFLSLVENAINNELTSSQKQWIETTLRDISSDLKADDYDDLGIDEMLRPLFLKEIKTLLKEYSEKFISDTIDRWKQEDPDINSDIAKRLITRFDQIKSGLSSKLNVVALDDELKKNNNYLNLDKYSYSDLVKLIKSIPEKEKNVKKQAINRFVDRFEVDKPTASSYVARFLANRDKIKFGLKDGIPELGLSPEDIKNSIPNYLQGGEKYYDPRNWKWEEFEQTLDGLFPSQKTVDDTTDNNSATAKGDKIYDKDGFEIWKGDDVNKCIEYNPTNPETKRKKYGWCVTQPGNTNYDYYRFKENRPTFYFVFDRTQSDKKDEKNYNFANPWHAFVLQVNKDGKTYVVTAADNRGDKPVDSWENIPTKTNMNPETWAKLQPLKDYFKPIALSSVEKGRLFASGKNLNLEEFKELNMNDKILYIQGKASKNMIGDDILEVLPQFPKIKVDGRSTTLANIAIDSGQKFPYYILKDREKLAERYAIFRARHTDYGEDPIALPYLKYLDDETQIQYMEKFDKNLSYEFVKNYLGEKAFSKYVEKEAKNLNFLPKDATQYIENKELKKLYTLLNKLNSNWKYSKGHLSNEELEKTTTPPTPNVQPRYLTYNQFKDLSPNERNIVLELIKKYNNKEKYAHLLYTLPLIIKYDGGEEAFFLPDKPQGAGDRPFYSNSWVAVRPSDMKIIERFIEKDPDSEERWNYNSEVGDLELLSGVSSLNKYLDKSKINFRQPEF